VTIPLPDPFDGVPTATLYDWSLALHLACGRNRAVLKAKHREKVCSLSSTLDVELVNRGERPLAPPFKA
jgi:hypothetical protein